MTTETSSIDDLLTGISSQSMDSPEINEEVFDENDYTQSQPTESFENEQDVEADENKEQEEIEDSQETETKELDDYGNPKTPPRTYTEEEVNERINKAVRDRLARGNHQPNQQTNQQQNYKQSGEEGDWQSELAQFVKQTVSQMTQEQLAQQQAAKEQQAEEEFRDKFTQGMDKFSDFRETVGSQPMTDAMTLALRGFKDPASFIYAASKRHGAELQRISQISDPYSQIVEMGKLEERMRKSPQTTKAPRPLSRNSEDTGIKFKEKQRDDSIEDLIAQSEQRKLIKLRQIRGR